MENKERQPPRGKRETKIPKRARFKPPKRFLEEYLDDLKLAQQELFKDSGSCVKARGFPKDLDRFISKRLRLGYLRGWNRKSSAIMYRVLITASLLDCERELEGYTLFRDSMYRAFDEEPTSHREKAESEAPKISYDAIGWSSENISNSKNFYTCSDDESSRIHTLSDNTGLKEMEILVLIISKSILKAKDKKIVPDWVRRRCRRTIKNIMNKLREKE